LGIYCPPVPIPSSCSTAPRAHPRSHHCRALSSRALPDQCMMGKGGKVGGGLVEGGATLVPRTSQHNEHRRTTFRTCKGSRFYFLGGAKPRSGGTDGLPPGAHPRCEFQRTVRWMERLCAPRRLGLIGIFTSPFLLRTTAVVVLISPAGLWVVDCSEFSPALLLCSKGTIRKWSDWIEPYSPLLVSVCSLRRGVGWRTY